jgi:hypothetical protein
MLRNSESNLAAVGGIGSQPAESKKGLGNPSTLRKFLEEHGTRIATPEERSFETEGEVVESGFRRTLEGRDAMIRSLVRAVYRFRDATLVADKKEDFGGALQNLYRELERAENTVGPS